MYVFISHSSKDAVTASKLADTLENRGNGCFIAPRDIRGGHEYAEEIIDGIDKSDAMVLVLSENSNQSPHVLREVERAVSKRIPVIIYKLEEVKLTRSMEYFLMTHQWINAAGSGEDYKKIADCIDSLGAGKKDTAPDTAKPAVKQRKRAAVFSAAAVLFVICGIIAGAALYTAFCKTANAKSGILPGSTVIFGTYNDAPISWRVINISEDKRTAVLVSENILTMKAFDAAESGRYSHDGSAYIKTGENLEEDLLRQTAAFGNSDWSKSNIRVWLNSDAEVVAYEDQSPKVRAMSDMKNGYDDEAGFLHNFTQEEKTAIRNTQLKTKGNALSGGNDITTDDKVYLLSRDELKWFDESGVSKFAVPTAQAIEKDQTKWYKGYSLDLNVTAYFWWLRDPEETGASKCYTYGNGYANENISLNNVGAEGFGIRPAVTVDIDAVNKLGRIE